MRDAIYGLGGFPTLILMETVVIDQIYITYVTNNKLDGVDIDYEDTQAFKAGTGEQWLITFTRRLRALLPLAIITHALQGPYFINSPSLFRNGAYRKVHAEVGSLIQFYNVQFYNQDSTSYNTSRILFNVSGGWAPKTSVNQIAATGVPLDKIVVGKPTIAAQAYNTGYMTAKSLSNSLVAAYKHNGYRTGVMFWQYSTDKNGQIMKNAVNALNTLIASGG